MTDDEWLKSLKPGDRVALDGTHQATQIREVAKVTPTGRVVLDDGTIFTRTYRATHMYGGQRISSLTPEVEERVRRFRLQAKIEAVASKLHHLPTEALRQIVAIIEAHELSRESTP